MNIAAPRETAAGETRAALVPAGVSRLRQLGAGVTIESGLGAGAAIADAAYESAGATVTADRRSLIASADLVLRVRKPPAGEVEWLKPGAVHASFLDPFHEPDLVRALARRGVSAISMELIPRTTRAQTMDALSSQANLAGYAAVILAAANLPRIFPMMMTAAGTIAAVRVLVIGAGVAGLQAIATARRLGAAVAAYDTRPAVEEQVKSLGARFLKIDLGETGQTAEGYARALSEEQLRRQREAMKQFCAEADVVLTAAQVFGRRAPVLLTREMVAAMKPGSVVVDLAVESGGNVEDAPPDQVTDWAGVKLIAPANLPGRVPAHASQVYSTNLIHLIEEYWDRDARRLALKPDDEILKGCLLTRDGRVCHERLAHLNPP